MKQQTKKHSKTEKKIFNEIKRVEGRLTHLYEKHFV